MKAGRHDHGMRRQSKRSARERGCWTYIPAETLLAAGISPAEPAPFYRTWATSRGGVMIRLYRQP